MADLPRRIKRALRELAEAAYEIELGRALAGVRQEFARWEGGDITAFELAEVIHQFHQGPSRDLYNQYTSGMLNVVVAHAIVTGVLDRERVSPEVLEHLGPALTFYESQESA